MHRLRASSRFGLSLGLAGLLLLVWKIGSWADETSVPVSRHWAFQPLRRPAVPVVASETPTGNAIDRFVLTKLSERRLALNPSADQAALLRRAAMDLTGLPPSPEELSEFLRDDAPDAFERAVDRFLASPHFGERWGKWWLDATGYADSNGYFNADSDRPLAYRYRDYVVRSLNANKPFDQFIREQIAGDELCGFDAHQHERHATADMIDQLEATHFLRNGPDGSGESDGNPEEVLIDRYYALESAQQNLSSALLGLTMQCAKCHDHKFEPITQREYYQLQAHLFPIFNMQRWLKPNERFVHVNRPGELEAWESRKKNLEERIASQRDSFRRWLKQHRPASAILFADDFDGPEATFAQNWSNTAPGDDAIEGVASVSVTTATNSTPIVPAAERRNGTLRIIEGGPSGDKWVSTTRAFDWTPNQPGEWIQVSFDLIDNKVDDDGKPAERIAYFIATHDFNDNGNTAGGNILLDGNPAGAAVVYLDYPGADMKQRGTIGVSGYAPGRNLGVRVTNLDGKKFKLEQVVDGLSEDRAVELSADDLPDGGFGFEFCCGRSFVVDNVVVETSTSTTTDEQGLAAFKTFQAEYEARRKMLGEDVAVLQKEQAARPGKIAWASDVVADPPKVPLLIRGNVMTPGELVEPVTLRVLSGTSSLPTTAALSSKEKKTKTTGRRTALANWLTHRDSPAAALSARVQANRIWQRLMGRGIVVTTDNLGVSGAEPSHPELLEWLACELVDGSELGIEGNKNLASSSTTSPYSWNIKRFVRRLVTSATYRQSSELNEAAFAVDPDNRLLWRHSIRRLDAEAIRDSMLFAADRLDRRLGGPYVPTQRTSAAEVVVQESQPGANRRSIYLQQRRTQTLSLLNLFDAPAITFNCVQRPTTTMPLQSLSQLNSEFALARAREMASRLELESPTDSNRRVQRAFEVATGRTPTDDDVRSSLIFIETQTRSFEPAADATSKAWSDFCQMLLASNSFLYVE